MTLHCVVTETERLRERLEATGEATGEVTVSVTLEVTATADNHLHKGFVAGPPVIMRADKRLRPVGEAFRFDLDVEPVAMLLDQVFLEAFDIELPLWRRILG